MFKIIIISLFASSVLGAAIEERQLPDLIQAPMQILNNIPGTAIFINAFDNFSGIINSILSAFPGSSMISGLLPFGTTPKPTDQRAELFVREYVYLLNKISESLLSALTNSKRIWDEYKSLVHFSTGMSTLTA